MSDLVFTVDHGKAAAEALVRYYWHRKTGLVCALADDYEPMVQVLLGVQEFESDSRAARSSPGTFPAAPGISPTEEGWFILFDQSHERFKWEVVKPVWWDVLKLSLSQGVAVHAAKPKTPWTQEQIAQEFFDHRFGQPFVSKGMDKALYRLALDIFSKKLSFLEHKIPKTLDNPA